MPAGALRDAVYDTDQATITCTTSDSGILGTPQPTPLYSGPMTVQFWNRPIAPDAAFTTGEWYFTVGGVKWGVSLAGGHESVDGVMALGVSDPLAAGDVAWSDDNPFHYNIRYGTLFDAPRYCLPDVPPLGGACGQVVRHDFSFTAEYLHDVPL